VRSIDWFSSDWVTLSISNFNVYFVLLFCLVYWYISASVMLGLVFQYHTCSMIG